MKLTFLFIVFSLSISFLNAQIIDFPDANFKSALVNDNVIDTDDDGTWDSNADTNNDGEIQVSEAEAVINMRLSEKGINSLDGIEYFTNLIEFRTADNNISSVDFSNNLNLILYTSHREGMSNINVSQNINLEHLSLIQNSFFSLDITNNINLIELDITGNNFSNIDLSQNIDLVSLEFAGNNFTSIDLSHNVDLEYIWATNNPLNELDLTSNIRLRNFQCAQTPITNFDFSQCTNIRFITVFDNQLSSLDLSQNSRLKSINIQGNYFTSLDLSNNLELRGLKCDSNNITVLELANHPEFTYLDALYNDLTFVNIQNGNNTNVTSFRVNGNPDLTCIQVDDVEYSNNAGNWSKDNTAYYSEECSLGINANHINNVVIYPIPTSNILSVSSHQPIEELNIYSLDGTLLKNSKNTSSINVAFLSSGIYFIEIKNNETREIQKFIKE